MKDLSQPKLSIELIPVNLWNQNVRQFLSREKWDTIRRAVYKAANNVCEICGGVGPKHPVECHEKWEYDDVNCTQTLVGFVALCPTCHGAKHLGYVIATEKNSGVDDFIRVVDKLKEVNSWTDERTALYILEQFEQWETRNQKEWSCDLTYAESFIQGLSNE